MKILIVPSWYPVKGKPIRGVFFKEQALALKKYGLDVVIAFPELWSLKTLGKHGGEKTGLICDNEDGLITYRHKGYNLFPKLPYMTGYIFHKRLREIYNKILSEQGKPDIIHAHSCLWGGYASARISQEEDIPLIITEHSTAFSRNMIKDYQKVIISKTLNVSKKVVVVGPGLQRDLEKYTNPEKVIIIPNIVDIDRFSITGNKRSNKFTFFSLAMLTHKKGMDILLKAFEEVTKNKSNVELVIGGEGPEKTKLEKLADELGISDNVKFIGKLSREEVIKNMNMCDCFVLVSRHETFGVVFVEALACGKPIIATASGGPDDIVNEDNGYLVPVEDVGKTAEAMNNVIDDYRRFDPQVIRKDCIDRFSEQAVVSRLSDLYENMINNQ